MIGPSTTGCRCIYCKIECQVHVQLAKFLSQGCRNKKIKMSILLGEPGLVKHLNNITGVRGKKKQKDNARANDQL